MKQGFLAVIALLLLFLFSSSAQAADTHAFVTQTTNASTLSFLDASNGAQFSGRALGINTSTGATYSADGSIAFVGEANEFDSSVALVVYSVPAGKHLGTVSIANGVFGAATAIPGTLNLFVSVTVNKVAAIYEVSGTTFTAKEVFKTGGSALALSPDGGTLYVSTGAALLSVSTTTFKQTASVAIMDIDKIAVTPDGSLLILAVPGQVAEYNPETMAVIGTVPADDYADVAISPDGSSFYTTLSADMPGPVTMLEQVSVATLTISKTVAIPSGVSNQYENPFAISPDGTELAIVGQADEPVIAFFALPALTPGRETPVGTACGVAFPTAAYISVTNCAADTVDVVDITSGVLKARYDAGPSPQSTLTSQNGTVLYVSNLYGVWALSPSTGTILSKVEFPGPYTESANSRQLALSADGTKLFAQYPLGVIEISTSTNKSIGPVAGVPAGFFASAIATSLDGKYLFVAGTTADFANSELLLLNQSTGALINTVSTVSIGNGILLIPSEDSTGLYYEGAVENVFFSLYDFNIALQTFTFVPVGVNGFNPFSLALSPDGTTLYTASLTVSALNTTTFVSTPVPSPVPASEIAITPDGSTLVVTSIDPELGVITIANPLIGVTIPVGGETGGVSVR